MKEWSFKNGIKVTEESFDRDLHCFNVYYEDNLLGVVYPGSIKDMNSCIKDLDEGEDPISGGWEDGCGNSCSLDGWL